MHDKKIYFKLSPELGDGCSCQILEQQGVIDSVSAWLTEAKYGEYVGETFTVECVRMSESEFNSLPEL